MVCVGIFTPSRVSSLSAMIASGSLTVFFKSLFVGQACCYTYCRFFVHLLVCFSSFVVIAVDDDDVGNVTHHLFVFWNVVSTSLLFLTF